MGEQAGGGARYVMVQRRDFRARLTDHDPIDKGWRANCLNMPHIAFIACNQTWMSAHEREVEHIWYVRDISSALNCYEN